MAEKRFSELPSATPMTGNEVTPVVQSSTTVKTPVKDISKLGYQEVISDATGARTLSATDRGAWLRLTAATTLTIPSNASIELQVGETFNGIQASAGAVTFTPDSGVTINVPSDYISKTRAQGSAWFIIKVAADEWDLLGDLEVAP